VEAGVFSLEEGLRLAVGKPGQAGPYAVPRLLLVSAERGTAPGAEASQEDYWKKPRGQQAARWDEAEKALKAHGVEVCLELGPRPVGRTGWLATAGRDGVEWAQVVKALGGLYVTGVEVDWAAYDAPFERRRVALPTYPFQRQRYWWRGATARPAAPRGETGIKPHLGRRLRSPALEALVYETTYGPSRPAHLNDHRLFGTLVAAGSSHISLVLSAIEDAYGSPACTLENLAFPQALVLGDTEERTLQVIITPQEQGHAFEVKSLGDADGAETWVLHALGGLRMGMVDAPKSLPSREELRARCQTRRSGDELYRLMRERGYTLGSGYQWISSVARQGNELLGEMRLPPLPDSLEDYPLYPGFVDSCFQVLASWALELELRDSLFIPFSISRFIVYRRPRGTVWCHARIDGRERGAEDAPIGGDLRILDEEGLVAEILGFRGRLASREAVRLATHVRREEARYEVIWRPESTPRPVPTPTVDTRTWVLCMDARGAGERLGRLLEEHGAPVVRVRPGAGFRALGAGAFELDARRPEDFTRLWSEAIGPGGCAGVVYLWGLDRPCEEESSADGLQNAVLETTGGALHVVKALAGRGGSAAPLWLVTQGAQAVKEQRPTLALAQAPLWGLGRVIDQEHPELRCHRVDLDPEDLEGSISLLYAELGRDGSAPERELAFRGGMRLYPSLRRDMGSRGAPPLRADATYLITGGLGALGLEVARWMVEQGARHLVLVGRRAPSASTSERVRALERAGAQVTLAAVDVSRKAEVTRLLQQLDVEAPPLRGIVHAAGVLDDGALLQQDLERFERVLAPKVAGAWNLHRLTEGRSLDFFVLFSSASATLGSAGQGNYAAANAFLDALAHERRARGLAAQSLDWGPWADAGMVGAADGVVAKALERRGIRPLPARQALALFGEALAGSRPQVALLSIHWPVYLEELGALGRSSFYEALAPARKAESRAMPQPTQPRYPLAERLQAALPTERAEVLTRSLQEEVMRILRLDSSTEIDWRQGFAELGMDSLMAIELRNVLQKGLGKSIPATVALDHPTIDFLVRHLLDEVLKPEAREAPPAPERKPEATIKPETAGAGAAMEKELDALSDAELARMVAEDLARES
jgi:NAD(P)-dependent dehydrogenase (short-subunit alcohol dehydrogenase family)/acyl carrier protein